MFKKGLIVAVMIATSLLAQDKPIRVYADITGDLLHAGHIEFFKKAKAFGDYLIIGVLSDETVASYKRKPIMSMDERAALIASCKLVDEVIKDPPLCASKEWLKEHEIDLVVHGDDFNPDLLVEQYGPAIEMGIFRSVPYTKGISTSELLERVNARGN
ncbi:MAG: Bifunctional protein HldE [Chlamydiia bacterium]|nr:Bifunctional protein HldE [Chlamydiia bacterium]MCH9615340.1 Bifunctional protein HldE [Chlamydiia bacterium]MCH9628338.1 Bifunctional protein HldE [Chlamydiia bacterium]